MDETTPNDRGGSAAADQVEAFAFESDFVASLRCIPMAVRFKLDLAGIKLSLRQWSRFDGEDRRALLVSPCASPAEVLAYRSRLVALIALRTDQPAKEIEVEAAPAWSALDAVPAVVGTYARSKDLPAPTLPQWRSLSDLRRFTLLKLTREGHDNVNFEPALREFGLLG